MDTPVCGIGAVRASGAVGRGRAADGTETGARPAASPVQCGTAAGSADFVR
ncbi:hypothetical protein SLNWT_0943 [Streptomyces albus]|uniref:Uncharacterized protein n=1 Tax=Streptomyces albus (strain ATCC 21838 / DSM 41398 / FERM P-419 / JCM 4703 / NBRC 107858) TaxID=1081613 RepID=A0A0B5EIP3_STRA4|nr:hypothetical protein SLNWT_0943 [Streptomyces albus]AOU75634.1 hypothetical protein SLNHY_0943 [Streptomyces albus]